jgi:small subunit ribosomal protein S1
MSADFENAAPSSAQTSMDELRPGQKLNGTVKRVELYGAFVDVGVGRDALLHISQLGKPNVRNVEDIVKAGDQVEVYVLRIDKDTGRIALSLEKPPAMTWDDLKEGMVITGKVVRVENFGAFVDIGAERPGMVHVSELSNGYVNSPSDVVKVGDEVEARIIKINRKKRQIDMSMKTVYEPVVQTPAEEENERVPTAMELALRRAMEGREDEETPVITKNDKRSKSKKGPDLDDIFSRTLREHQG